VEATISLTGQPESAARARHFVAATLQTWGKDDLVETATLLTSELVTNAVVHAAPPIGLAVTLLEGTIRVEVQDESDDIPVVGDADRHADRGRGLVLVDMLAASWGTQAAPPGKTVWFAL